MSDSRLSGFFKQRIATRLATLVERGFIDAGDVALLQQSHGSLPVEIADHMTENVVSVFGLPFAVAPNFLVNGRDYIVPMVIEEPSVVAGVSGAARLMRRGDGFSAQANDPILTGQVQLVDVSDPDATIDTLRSAEAELVEDANDLQPNLLKRGGGTRSIEFLQHQLSDGRYIVTLHIAVDTRDAMGANLVNTICEGIAPKIEALSGCRVGLSILSNLADKSLVTSTVTLPLDALRVPGFAAEAVRDGIVMANEIALTDRYRATTHNKGIMNGIDAVAIATGNDWRAVEAAAHAYACRDGSYRALTNWTTTSSGDLKGELTMPLKVGIVGSSLQSNPGARVGLKIAAVESATELSQLMCSVGLAQNFAALRALVTSGIQKGHMSLHARSVAALAGAPAEIFDHVVRGLIDSGEVKDWKAEELIAGFQQEKKTRDQNQAGSWACGSASGKVILLGEHAVVYGQPALAVPIQDAVKARCRIANGPVSLSIPAWHIRQSFAPEDERVDGAAGILQALLKNSGLAPQDFEMVVESQLPVAEGLGASAALAASMARALSACFDLGLPDDEINRLTYECEKIAHGEPSGIDNTLAVFGKPLLFQKQVEPVVEIIELQRKPPLVIACSGQQGATRKQVAGVRSRYERNPQLYEAVFDEIGILSRSGRDALIAGDYEKLGANMNVCHGLLNALEVSTPELESMIGIAREHGASGAKLTGAGGGGSIVALCPGTADAVASALRSAGYQTLQPE